MLATIPAAASKFTARDIIVKPIPRAIADEIVKRYHYSGKVVTNSQLSFGVLLGGKVYGAMQFGPSTDKKRMLGLVPGTAWNGFVELNRMAFSDVLPRNSESRAIAFALRWIRKNAPHVEWVISFADGTQCGHGTIYQASNFVLTQIKKNTTMLYLPGYGVANEITLRAYQGTALSEKMRKLRYTNPRKFLDDCYPGWKVMPGFMLRYIYFLTERARRSYNGDVIPFAKIEELGARMRRGERI